MHGLDPHNFDHTPHWENEIYLAYAWCLAKVAIDLDSVV